MSIKRLPYRVLTVAGSDSGGSAGIQADLKTFEACGVFGSTAITVATAQNTQAVRQAFPLPLLLVEAQIDAVLSDIGADAVKTGLLGRVEVVELVANRMQSPMPLVVDPVLVNGYGKQIVPDATITAYKNTLFSKATIITPNLDEAMLLTDTSSEDLHDLAMRLYQLGPQNVLVKGGHLSGATKIDLFFDGQEFLVLEAPTLPLDNPHGVGCTFASALAAELAKGKAPIEAATIAHSYLQTALQGALDWQVGGGRPPVNHRAGGC